MVDVKPKILIYCDKAGCQEGQKITLETILTPDHDIAGGISKHRLKKELTGRGWEIGDTQKPIGEWTVFCSRH